MSRSTRFNRFSTGGTYSTSSSTFLRNASSPITNSGTAYSSYLLRNSSSTADTYGSPRRNRLTESNLNDLTTTSTTTPSRPIKSYRGTKSNFEMSTSLDSGTATSNWRSRFNTDYDSPVGTSTTRHMTGTSLSRNLDQSASALTSDGPSYSLARSRSLTRCERDSSPYRATTPYRDRDISTSVNFRDKDVALSSSRNDYDLVRSSSRSRDREPVLDRDPHYDMALSRSASRARTRDQSMTREPIYSPCSEYSFPRNMTSSRMTYRDHDYMNGDPLSPTAGLTPMPMPSRSRSAHPHPDYYADRYSKFNTAFPVSKPNYGLMRSNSYKDLREFDPDFGPYAPPRTSHRSRARHQTLAYGVSAADLGMARNGFHDLAMDWRSGVGGHGVPLVAPATAPMFKSSDLKGFSSDMSAGHNPHGVSRSSSSFSSSSQGCHKDHLASDDAGYASQSVSRRSSLVVRLFYFIFYPLVLLWRPDDDCVYKSCDSVLTFCLKGECVCLIPTLY